MNKIIPLSILLAIGISCASSKSKNEDEMVEEKLMLPYKKSNNSLFWEITGNGLTKSSYLFGTIHIISKDDYFLGNNVQKAIEYSDLFVTEVALNNLLSIDIMQDMMLSNDSSLSDLMTSADYKKLKDFYKERMKMDESVFELTLSKMSPIVIQQQIGITAFGDQTTSYEMELAKLAGNSDLENVGLETADLQMEILKSIPAKDQISMLMYTIENVDKSNQEIYKMVDLYKQQDLEGLATLINKSEASKEFVEKHMDSFVANRNSRWIPQLDSLMKEKSCFVAVGAGHLPETDGLIKLLQKKGYQVKPLENN